MCVKKRTSRWNNSRRRGEWGRIQETDRKGQRNREGEWPFSICMFAASLPLCMHHEFLILFQSGWRKKKSNIMQKSLLFLFVSASLFFPYSHEHFILKGSPKNESSIIIYSPSCNSKAKSFSFFSRSQRRCFARCLYCFLTFKEKKLGSKKSPYYLCTTL